MSTEHPLHRPDKARHAPSVLEERLERARAACGQPTSGRRWQSLTVELRNRDSAPRRLIDEVFPFPHLPVMQAQYRNAIGPLLAPGAGGRSAGTVGTAFDIWVQLQGSRRPWLLSAIQGAAHTEKVGRLVFQQLARGVGVPIGEVRPGVTGEPAEAVDRSWGPTGRAAAARGLRRTGRVRGGVPNP